MNISTAITHIRQELDDDLKSRWVSDDRLLRFIARAVDRAQHLIRKHAPQLMISTASLAFNSTTDAINLPADFLSPLGVTRSTGEALAHVPEHEWDSVVNVEECRYWHIFNGQIEVKKAPSSDFTCTLRYHATVLPYALTLSSDLPWGGRFDGPILDYATNRARLVDEMNINVDMQLMNELEARIMDTLGLWGAGIIESSGWNSGN